jgi:hypothetical protein
MESNNKMRYISAMDVSYKDGIERPFIEIGQIVWVADNSGVKKVKISKWLTQSVYLVKVISVRLGYEKKIPIGTELCGVLVRFTDFGYYSSNQVCLFKTHHLLPNYIGGDKMFTHIYGGTVAPRNDLEHYTTILNACCLQPNDYVRVDLETYANIRRIKKLEKGLDGSEFEVVLTSGNRFFSETGFKKWQLVNGVLRRRPFRTNVTTSSLLAYSFDVYQLDIFPMEGKQKFEVLTK